MPGNDPDVNDDDSRWLLLAECPLSALPANEGAACGPAAALFQAMRERGVPPDCLHRIEATLADIAQGAAGPFTPTPDRPGFALSVSLFCHGETSAGTRRAGDPHGGGWGYYVIERGSDSPAASREQCRRIIELYLYREGG